MQSREEFLERHREADSIVVDAETGELVKAEYGLLDKTGNYRKEPAVYWYPEY